MTTLFDPADRETLLQALRSIQANKYQPIPDTQASDYLPAMVHFIGDPDPELRDELIYATFSQWISQDDLLSSSYLHELVPVLLDNDHLFFKIGSRVDTSVFTRTFSVLVVALLLYRHRKQTFLSLDEVKNIKSALLDYLAQEKDWRGYTADHGWAHAAAHTADALDELVQCAEINAAVQMDVLASLIPVLWNGRTIFCDEEDERIATLICSTFRAGKLPTSKIIDWANQLLACLDQPRSQAQYCARVNSKNLMRCLYFRFQGPPDASKALLAKEFLSVAQKLNRFLET